uniref:Uncharacterized protein n=1 Tax=Arundo donax TaxID=35708 RepID=A0A0A9HIQ3_ARUDO
MELCPSRPASPLRAATLPRLRVVGTSPRRSTASAAPTNSPPRSRSSPPTASPTPQPPPPPAADHCKGIENSVAKVNREG